jgi:hypothetical protein
MPPLLYDIIWVLLLAGPAAFVCLLNAGIALRRDGGSVFWVGGGFSKWMLWAAVIFLGLEPTPLIGTPQLRNRRRRPAPPYAVAEIPALVFK